MIQPKKEWVEKHLEELEAQKHLQKLNTQLDAQGQSKLSIEFVTNLKKQFRRQCSEATSDWICSIYQNNGQIKPFPFRQGDYHVNAKENGYIKNDDDNLKVVPNCYALMKEKDEEEKIKYEIGIFASAAEMRKHIQEKKEEQGGKPAALLATYSWDQHEEWFLGDETVRYKWHDKNGDSAWTMESDDKTAEVYEVGSIHNIQGRDLNYAGVILGRSIAVDKSGCIVFNYKYRGEIGHLSDEPDGAQTMIKNEIGVLLTRGAKGLYIYAVDSGLRQMLIDSLKAGEQDYKNSQAEQH